MLARSLGATPLPWRRAVPGQGQEPKRVRRGGKPPGLPTFRPTTKGILEFVIESFCFSPKRSECVDVPAATDAAALAACRRWPPPALAGERASA